MKGSKQGHWLRIAGVNVVLKEDQENAINGKQKDSVREDGNAVLGPHHLRFRLNEKCCKMIFSKFFSYTSFVYRKWRFLCKRRRLHTAPRTSDTRKTFFSRVAQG